MKNINSSRIISTILIIALTAASLAGCGLVREKKKVTKVASLEDTVYIETDSPLKDILKSADSSSGENSEEASEDEISDDMEEERFNFSGVSAVNGKYYTMYTDIQNEGMTCLCVFDEEGKNSMTLPLPSLKDGSISQFSVAPDESIRLVFSEYDEKKEVFVWQMGCYKLETGEQAKLSQVWKTVLTEEEDFFTNGMVSTASDTYVLTETSLIVYDNADGSEKTKLNLPDGFLGNICLTPAGEPLLVGSGAKGVTSFKPDLSSGKYAKTDFNASDIFIVDTVASGSGSYDFFVATGSDLYGFKMAEAEPVKVMNYVASDLEVASVSGAASLSENTIVLLFVDAESGMHAGLFKKGDASHQEGKTALSLACTYASVDLSKAVVSFNKKSDKYRINLKEYPYDDEGNSVLNMEIASGNIPDMLCVSADMPIESYAAKGMFEDLEPYFTGDKEISRIDYMDNILEAFKIDGKMYFVTPSFNVIGLIGKKKDFKDTRGVTTSQIEKMMKERNIKYDTVMGIASRETLLSWVIYCALEEYVDWDAGTCSFGSYSFINLLEFCDKFPKKINYENVNWSEFEAGMREGRQLLRDGYLYNFDGYMQERYGYVGEEISFMGYPGNGNNGPVVQSEEAIAISHGAADPDGCWEFLRTFYLEDYQNRIDIAFPISEKAFDRLAEKAMNPPNHTYTDENGKEVTEPETGVVNLNGKDIKLPVTSKEDVEAVRKILKSLDMKASVDSKISEIINDEAGAFFAGQKGAKETADIIQSRVKVYISETK